MRILYFSEKHSTHDNRFLKTILEGSHEPYYLRLFEEDELLDVKRVPKGVQIVRFRQKPARNDFSSTILDSVRQFDELLEHIRPDLVHSGPVHTCGLIVGLSGYHPHLLMSWGSDVLHEASRNEQARWVASYSVRKADGLFCDCEAVREKITELGGDKKKDCFVIPWGIDLDAFSLKRSSLNLRDKLGWTGKLVIISTRTWEKIYGIEILLEAFKLLTAKSDDFRLILLGTGSLSTWVDSFLLNERLTEKVHLAGRIDQSVLPEYYREADIYVTCSYSDGTSVSLLEALAVGLPVVASDIRSNREWISEGTNGWLAKTGNPDSFARCIEKATFLSIGERKKLADRNRKLAEEKADWKKNIVRLLYAYDHLRGQVV